MKRLVCQECGGAGTYINDSIDMGSETGPIMFHITDTCGWCNGKGTLSPKERGLWLRYKKQEKHEQLRASAFKTSLTG